MPKEILLPWPNKHLNPNARVHWSKKSRAAAADRRNAYMHCMAGELAKEGYGSGRLHLWIDFYPPNRKRRDDDNLLSMFKPSRDGIADYLGIDDARFISHPMIRDEIGGFIKFRITQGPVESE